MLRSQTTPRAISTRTICTLLFALAFFFILPRPAMAYIGPGAGIALAGSAMAVLVAIFSAIFLLVAWPVRFLFRLIFRHRGARGQFKRVVVLGLDGLDHSLTQKMIADGKLPHFAALAKKGCFKPLASTVPPLSPAAWSSFQTGVNPGKHNIFDFIMPDTTTYRAKMSSAEVRPPRRMLRLGKFQFPLGRADVRLLRKSQPFWNILGKHGVFSSIIRVPITFPPEKLRGVSLSAMCVPDLRGTQGTFSHYTTAPADESKKEGGEVHRVERQGVKVNCKLFGPPNPLHGDGKTLIAPFTVTIISSTTAELNIDGEKYKLRLNEQSDWARVRFRMAPGLTMSGVVRFVLLSTEPEFSLYATPVNIDPERPALPIGYPAAYPVYLAKRHGAFATLGLAEDTWALNDQILDDQHFLDQSIAIDREREAMFFDSLSKVDRGLCVCVFDGTDRVQHMFWRYLEHDHPARPKEIAAAHASAIDDLYRRMDDLVGRTVEACNQEDTLLMVISDHGFNTFRRGVDLNRWLEENGYLVVDDARRGSEHLEGVDWSKTRAFAIGLTGIFLNVRDRFSQGIVTPGEEADRLRDEIAGKLATLVDPKSGEKAIRRVYQSVKFYRGPYAENAPDLIVGYDRGYRVSWEAAIGKTTRDVFHDNTKAWSGDHCVDVSVVPGVLFSNHAIDSEQPRLLDMGPTILKTFGVTPPDYMDGVALAVGAAEAAT